MAHLLIAFYTLLCFNHASLDLGILKLIHDTLPIHRSIDLRLHHRNARVTAPRHPVWLIVRGRRRLPAVQPIFVTLRFRDVRFDARADHAIGVAVDHGILLGDYFGGGILSTLLNRHTVIGINIRVRLLSRRIERIMRQRSASFLHQRLGFIYLGHPLIRLYRPFNRLNRLILVHTRTKIDHLAIVFFQNALL